MRKSLIAMVSLLSLSPEAFMQGELFEFTSPNGISESCIITTKVPGGHYSKKDKKKESKFCKLDLHGDQSIGICPKTWSTSPGTIVYDLDKRGNYSGRKNEFEQEVCGTSKTRAHKSVAKFKNTLNEDNTSGTYSKSSLLYYHMSRYLDTSVDVPVAVYREIDREEHLERVAKVGKRSAKASMIKAGWNVMVSALENPTSFIRRSTLFTDDYQKIYGIMLKDKGERYGAEINGVRSSWGEQSSLDFQETPAFRVLKTDLPIVNAVDEVKNEYGKYIKWGLKKFKRGFLRKGNPEALKAVKSLQATYQNMSKAQLIYWAKELSEIVILDYIFSQQDRIGNIDYKWYAYWTDASGELKKEKLDSEMSLRNKGKIVIPEDIKANNPILLQRSTIGDNDAGGRTAYSNFTKRTGMVEKMRHINLETYEKLKALARDFKAQGPLYDYFSQTFDLKQSNFNQLVNNTISVFEILKTSCKKGKLKADLEPKEYLKSNTSGAKEIACL